MYKMGDFMLGFIEIQVFIAVWLHVPYPYSIKLNYAGVIELPILEESSNTNVY